MGRQEYDRSVALEVPSGSATPRSPELPMVPDQAAQSAMTAARRGRDPPVPRGEGNRVAFPRTFRTTSTGPCRRTSRPSRGSPSGRCSRTRRGRGSPRSGGSRSRRRGSATSRARWRRTAARTCLTRGSRATRSSSRSPPATRTRSAVRSTTPARSRGSAFYSEELLLSAGLYADAPKAREMVANYMRLRALRVEVDVKLALGYITIPQAAEYLQTSVPMDAGTARAEAASFASAPGPGDHVPDREAPGPAPPRRGEEACKATRSGCARSTTSSIGTATCRSRSSGGSSSDRRTT